MCAFRQPQLEIERRELRAVDLPRMHEIEEAVYADPWSRSLLEQSLVAPMTHAWGLFEADRLIAYAIFQLIVDEGHLLNIAVDPERQGQGLGAFLLDSVIQTVEMRGGRRVFLEVRPTNDRALRLYESRQFMPVTLRERYYSNGESALVMCRDLGRDFYKPSQAV